MASLKAPLLDATGKSAKDVALEETVFGAEVKAHLVHEAVRAELASRRAGTSASKSRGLVSGGRSKPWRQKGTGRARQGTIRAPQFTAGGHAFRKVPRSFVLKVNRKAAKAALRSALASHAAGGTLALLDGSSFDVPSTKLAVRLLETWGKTVPLLVVATRDEAAVAKSFANLQRVVVVPPEELEVAGIVWARALLVTEAALPAVQGRAA